MAEERTGRKLTAEETQSRAEKMRKPERKETSNICVFPKSIRVYITRR